MNPKTLYVTDLDGTLIRDDLTLSPWSRRELVSLLDRGALITVATARSIVSLSAILGDIPFRLPVVEFNGAFVTEYRSRHHLLVQAIDPALAHAVHSAITATGMLSFISAYDGAQDLLFYQEVRNPGEAAYFKERVSFADDRLRQVKALEPVLDHQVVCFTLIDKEEHLRALARELASSFGGRLVLTIYGFRYFPGWHFLSIHDAKATKDQGIRALQKGFGLEEAELVVFGDDVNDISMFRVAGRAVAVGNALDEVKAAAHEVIGSNQEDSVLRWITSHDEAGQRSVSHFAPL
jgi:5-amino-6-(5-phospho-D-ribitylamino)uracil phosphatase